ncbi:MAG: NAD(P)/FAD-dependent oxidoreductase [Syntrophobacterales bacterium]|nr:MAG: NAD(P)/FAD-dependent oxidoreductase [Syntrophobacterales bacterium]
MEYDVIIVGAGPAGSTTARLCAKKGLRTLLIEKDRFPRYKPCGGYLSPRVLRELDFDIGGVIESSISEMKLTFRLKDPFSIVSQDPIGYVVMRESFDHLLCRKAQDEGADLYEGRRVVGFQEDMEGVDVSIKGGESVRCRYLVGADGARSIVAQSLRGGVMRRAGVAFQGEGRLAGVKQRRWSFVHLDFGGVPYGYGWIFPKGSVVSTGIGVLFPSKGVNLKSRFERFIGCVDYIKGMNMERTCFYPLPVFSAEDLPVSKGRVLLVGDAANLIDPMTGEGISYTVRSGKMAGEAIVSAIKGDQKGISRYREALECTLFQDLTVALKLAKAVYRFPKLTYNVLKSNKNLGLLYLNILAGNAHYDAFSREMVEGIRRRLRGKSRPRLHYPWNLGKRRPTPFSSIGINGHDTEHGPSHFHSNDSKEVFSTKPRK